MRQDDVHDVFICEFNVRMDLERMNTHVTQLPVSGRFVESFAISLSLSHPAYTMGLTGRRQFETTVYNRNDIGQNLRSEASKPFRERIVGCNTGLQTLQQFLHTDGGGHAS